MCLRVQAEYRFSLVFWHFNGTLALPSFSEQKSTIAIVFALYEAMKSFLGSPAWHIPGIIVCASSPHVEGGICGRAASQNFASC